MHAKIRIRKTSVRINAPCTAVDRANDEIKYHCVCRSRSITAIWVTVKGCTRDNCSELSFKVLFVRHCPRALKVNLRDALNVRVRKNI